MTTRRMSNKKIQVFCRPLAVLPLQKKFHYDPEQTNHKRSSSSDTLWEDHTLVQAFWIYSNHDTHCEQLHDWMDARIIVRTRSNTQEEQQQQDEHITSVFGIIIANFHIAIVIVVIIIIITTKVHIGHQSERSHVWHVGTG